MFLHRVQATIIFQEFLALTAESSFDGYHAEEVLALVRSFNDAALYELQKRPNFGNKRFEGAILKVWEMARGASKRGNTAEITNWRTVMATCNATYEAVVNTRAIFMRRAA